MFSAGFIQKTDKVYQIIKVNRAYPQRKQPHNVPEDSRRHHTEVEGEAPPGGIGRPYLLAGRPLGPTC